MQLYFTKTMGAESCANTLAWHPPNQTTRRYNVSVQLGEKFKSSTTLHKIV